MKMRIEIPKHKPIELKGEVDKLCEILEIIKSMNHDEQWRTVTYLKSRLDDQKTIADIEILDQ